MITLQRSPDVQQSHRLRLNTLIRLRWLAIIGQSVTVLVVAYGLQFPLPVGLCFALIACSAWMNLFLAFRYSAAHRLKPSAAMGILIFDSLQLAGLLYMTGGLTNPFSLLLTVPVVISATSLPLMLTALLGVMVMAAASLLNSRIVGRLGMRRVSHGALIGYILFTGTHALIALSGHETLLLFALFQGGAMFCFGLIGPNFGALAMDPLGHVAGTASSVQGFVTTVVGALLGFYIGQHFDGTVVPITLGFALCGLVALIIVLIVEKGRLFHPAPGRT